MLSKKIRGTSFSWEKTKSKDEYKVVKERRIQAAWPPRRIEVHEPLQCFHTKKKKYLARYYNVQKNESSQ